MVIGQLASLSFKGADQSGEEYRAFLRQPFYKQNGMVTDPLYDYREEYITVFLPVRSTSWDQPCRVIGRVVRRARVGVSGPRHLDHPPPFAVETEYGRRKTRSASHRITDLQAFSLSGKIPYH